MSINTNLNIFRNDGGFIAGTNVDINSGELDNAIGLIVSSETLAIDTNGEKLSNTRSEDEEGFGIRAGTVLNIKTGALDNTSGLITSAETLNIDTFLSRPDGTSESNEIDNSFGLISGRGLTLNSGQLTNHLGQIASTDFININTNGQSFINKGTGEGLGVIGVGRLELRTGLLDNSFGRLVSRQVDIDTNGNRLNNDGGFITGFTELLINSGEFSNSNEARVYSLGTIDIDTNGGDLHNFNNGEHKGIISLIGLNLRTGKIDNTGGRIISNNLNITAGTNEIRNGFGFIRGNDSITIRSGALENDAGTILSKNNLVINTIGRVIVNAGLIQSEAGDLTIDTNGNEFLNYNSGESGGILSKGKLTLTTGRFENNTARIASDGDLVIDTNLQEMRNYLSGTDYGILSNGTIDLRTGKLDNNTGTIESVGNLTINTNLRELFNFNSGIVTNPDGTIGLGGKGISSKGFIFLNTGKLDNSFGTIQSDRSITINANLLTVVNRNSTANGGKGIIAAEHIGIFNASLDNTDGLLRSQTFSLNGIPSGSPAGSINDDYFGGTLHLTGIRHLVEGPSNPLRDPFDKQNWVLNGVSNSVSDFLSLDLVADSAFAAANPDFPLGERFQGGATLGGLVAIEIFGGAVATKALGFGGRQLAKLKPVVTKVGNKIVSVRAFKGIKQSVKNRINVKNYGFKVDDIVPCARASANSSPCDVPKISSTYKGANKWIDDVNVPEQLKADIGDNLESDLGVLFDSATDAQRGDLIKGWQSLSELSQSVRTDVFNIETVARHLKDTGKLADNVATEIAQSGSYNKWLSDNFVTYIKNGFKLNKTSIDRQFASHVNVVERVSSNNVSGGHNSIEFFKKVYDPVTNPNQRVVVLNQQSLSQPGWSVIEYKTYKVDAAGNLKIPLELNAGRSMLKTVYDPAVVSQASLKDAAYKAFKNAIDDNRFGLPRQPPNYFEGVADGVTYAGFFDPITREIITWYVK